MKTTTAADDPEAFAKLQDLVRDLHVAMVTTVAPEGALRSRPMATAAFEDDGVVWFFTADDSGKVHDLEQEQAVNVSYADPRGHRYVSITGNASVVHDRDRAKDLWQPAFKAYFPGGLDEPHLALIAVRIETAEFWDAPTSRMVQLLAITKAAPTGDDPALGEHTKVAVRAAPASG